MRLLLPPLFIIGVLGIIAAASVATGQPLMAPSLGAAAYSQMIHADEASARVYNIFVGQLVGAIAGFVGVILAGQAHAVPFTATGGVTDGRLLAICIAVGLGAVAQIACRARTPVGGATALVVALGVEHADAAGAIRLFVAIGLITVLGEIGRRVLLRFVPATGN